MLTFEPMRMAPGLEKEWSLAVKGYHNLILELWKLKPGEVKWQRQGLAISGRAGTGTCDPTLTPRLVCLHQIVSPWKQHLFHVREHISHSFIPRR